MRRYFKSWLLMTTNAFQEAFASRAGIFLFTGGKLVRFGFFFFLLVTVFSRTEALAGYSLDQVVFFFLTFNLVDILAQSFLREVYRFRHLVVSGDFDLILIKPIHPLLRVLFGGADIMDMITIPPLVVLIVVFALKIGSISPASFFLYIVLVLNAFLIAVSFHILSLVLGILTTSVDHTIWIYRDLTSMGRIPVDFYNQVLRALLTFVAPVAVMMTFPAKAMMGILSAPMILYSFGVGVIFLWLSFLLWSWSLTRYSSASS